MLTIEMVIALLLYVLPGCVILIWSFAQLVEFFQGHARKPYSVDLPIEAVFGAALFWVPGLNLLGCFWLAVYYAFKWKVKTQPVRNHVDY